MALEYAILGFLQHKPLSGYDMKKTIDMTTRHFWSADQSQIYRTLSKLATDGLIEVELVIQDGKPNSKIYHITEKGKDDFLAWLKSSAHLAEPKVPWLIQVFFAANLTDEEIIGIFKQIVNKLQYGLAALGQVNKTEIIAGIGNVTPRDIFFKDLTYDYGLTLHRTTLEWLEKTIVQLQKGTHPQK